MFISNLTTPILFVISFSFFLYAVLSVALCAALLMVYAVVTARDGYEDEARSGDPERDHGRALVPSAKCRPACHA